MVFVPNWQTNKTMAKQSRTERATVNSQPNQIIATAMAFPETHIAVIVKLLVECKQNTHKHTSEHTHVVQQKESLL